MTPQELAQIRVMITDAVRSTVKTEIALAVQPLREELDALKEVDKRHDSRLGSHSGAHKDLATNVRKSLDEVKVATIESVDAKLDAFRTEMRAERAELVKAPEAAMQASKSAASAALDTEQIRSKQLAEAHDQRVRFWVTIIPVIAGAIATILKLFL